MTVNGSHKKGGKQKGHTIWKGNYHQSGQIIEGCKKSHKYSRTTH